MDREVGSQFLGGLTEVVEELFRSGDIVCGDNVFGKSDGLWDTVMARLVGSVWLRHRHCGDGCWLRNGRKKRWLMLWRDELATMG